MDAFRHDLKDSLSEKLVEQDPDCMVECYNATLRSVLDKHAPIQTKTVLIKPKLPWYDSEIQTSKTSPTPVRTSVSQTLYPRKPVRFEASAVQN